MISKKQMTEEDIKLRYITPAINTTWKLSQITMETKITDGKINLKGNLVVRERPKKADYVLYLNDSKPIACWKLRTTITLFLTASNRQ